MRSRLRNSDLTLVVDIFGTEYVVDKNQAGSELTHATRIAAGDFANIASNAAVTDTVRLFVVDGAGNRSSERTAADPPADDANEAGNSFVDDKVASGVSNAVGFLIDSTGPDLSVAVDPDDPDTRQRGIASSPRMARPSLMAAQTRLTTPNGTT